MKPESKKKFRVFITKNVWNGLSIISAFIVGICIWKAVTTDIGVWINVVIGVFSTIGIISIIAAYFQRKKERNLRKKGIY